LYRTPVYALGSKIFSGANLGMARGALELTMADVENRVAVSGLRVAEQSTVQSRIAEADAELEAAWALLSNDCEIAMQLAKAGETPDLAVRMRWRRNDAYATKLCLQAVERLHTLAGARRMTSDNLFQRAWRDLHAGAAQVQVNWDLQSTNFGRVAFGQPPLDARI
jgi:alkylation response protein AidB-like acyl-CoA dehydrogenase